jgi:hypothetical protein
MVEVYLAMFAPRLQAWRQLEVFLGVRIDGDKGHTTAEPRAHSPVRCG